MKNIWLLGLIFCLFSCKMAVPPIDYAKECAERYPVRTDTFHVVHESVVVDTFMTVTDTVFQKVAVECPPSGQVAIVEKLVPTVCPPIKTITKTVTKTDSIKIYMENTARIAECAQQLDTQRKMYDKTVEALAVSNHRRKVYLGFAVFGWLLVLAFCTVIYLIWKRNTQK